MNMNILLQSEPGFKLCRRGVFVKCKHLRGTQLRQGVTVVQSGGKEPFVGCGLRVQVQRCPCVTQLFPSTLDFSSICFLCWRVAARRVQGRARGAFRLLRARPIVLCRGGHRGDCQVWQHHPCKGANFDLSMMVFPFNTTITTTDKNAA